MSDVMDCLVFHIYGAMSSWGDVSIGSLRTTRMYPSKSGVIGLVSAALGIDRYDTDAQRELSRGYDVVVAVAGGSSILRDFHTIQTSKGSDTEVIVGGARRHELGAKAVDTMLSTREYVLNGFYSVFLVPRSDCRYTLQDLRSALERPHYVPYLGRKSCPVSFPMVPSIVTYDRMYDAIVGEAFRPFLEEGSPFRKHLQEEKSIHIYATSEVEGAEGVAMRRVRDEPSNRDRWQFTERDEYEYRAVMP